MNNGKLILKRAALALAGLPLPFLAAASEAAHGSAEGGANPEFWVLIFTVISFLSVMAVLGYFGWPQILKALHEREELIKKSLEAAEEARKNAEIQSAEYNKRMAEMESRTQQLLSEAQRQAAEVREKLIKDAEASAKDLMSKTRQQLEAERASVVKSVRSELAGLVVTASEKLLRKSVDKSIQDQMVKELSSQLEN